MAPSRPTSLDPSDTDNLVWAVVGRPNDLGHGAKTFANLSDPPPIEWLAELERRETDRLTAWSEATEKATIDKAEAPPRPALQLEPLTVSVGVEGRWSLSASSRHLIDWLVRRLDAVELVDWVLDAAAKGRRLHPEFRLVVRQQLETSRLAPGFELFWRLVSAEGGWMRAEVPSSALWDAHLALVRQDLQPWMRQELLSLLHPYIELSASYRKTMQAMLNGQGQEAEPIGQTLSSLAEGEVQLSAKDRIKLIADAIDKLEDPDQFLANLADEFTRLVQSVLDLFAVLGRTNRDHDPSAAARPSIQPHEQNQHHDDWTLLIEWLWRGWARLEVTSPPAARALVDRWSRIPYLTFLRLRLTAMAHSGLFSQEEKLDALLNG